MIEWILFLALSAVAIVMASCVILTMSMYRAGLVLMISFLSIAGLFLLLQADLLAIIQVMMNVGGMMVMILFMVMIMMDPGGEMMWEMKRSMNMRGLGALSMTMPRGKPQEHSQHEQHHGEQMYACPMHPEVQQDHPGECPKCGMQLVPRHGDMQMSGENHHQMMVDMAMSTAQLPWALAIGAALAVVMIVFAVITPWPVTAKVPRTDATVAVGELLLSRYMIAFEGAAFLIVSGMVGAVVLGRKEPSP